MVVAKNIFYSPKMVCSRNAFINFLVGNRGAGKSFNTILFAIEEYIKKGRQFFYLRRYNTELVSALPNFFKQLQEEGYYTENVFKISKITKNLHKFEMDGEVIGYACALNTSLIVKSSSFPKVYNLIFDEVFLKRGTVYHYLKDEVILFLELIESVFRLRNGRCFLIANAISVSNPYFDYWKIKLNPDKKYEIYKDGLICVEQVYNEEFVKVKKQTMVGRLIDNSSYGDYAISNKMLQDTGAFIAWKPADSKVIATIAYDGKKLGLWSCHRTGCLYIVGLYNPNSRDVLSFSVKDHNENTTLTERASNVFKTLKTAFQYGCLYFENESIKNNVVTYLMGHVE